MPIPTTAKPQHVRIYQVNPSHWRVQSGSDSNKHYDVRLSRGGNPKLKTLYQCTCPTQPKLCCKHIDWVVAGEGIEPAPVKRQRPAWSGQERRSTPGNAPTQAATPSLEALAAKVERLQSDLITLTSKFNYRGRLGLTGGREYLQVRWEHGAPWHRSNGDSFEPVKAEALTGYLTSVRRVIEGKQYPQLHVHIMGLTETVIVSNFDNNCSKTMLAAFSLMEAEELQRPITLIPKYRSGDKVKHSYIVMNVKRADDTTVLTRTRKDYSNQELYDMAALSLSEALFPPQASIKPFKRQKPPDGPVAAPDRVNWGEVCRDLGISAGELAEVARSLGLPQSKLTPSQAGELWLEVYTRFSH